jgi:hypothetical protein
MAFKKERYSVWCLTMCQKWLIVSSIGSRKRKMKQAAGLSAWIFFSNQVTSGSLVKIALASPRMVASPADSNGRE